MSAPALSQGIQLLRRLAAGGAASLEALSAASKLPKSSALRLLETLIAARLVARDPRTKAFAATMCLVPVGEADFLQKRDRLLRNLCHATRQTAEWWEPDAGRMVLIKRDVPGGRELLVRAREGFLYAPDFVEAIPIIAAVRFFQRPKRAWRRWNGRAVLEPAPAAVVRQRLKEVQDRGLSMDREPNSNGVRRIAIFVRDLAQPRGIVALAVPPWPVVVDLEMQYLAKMKELVADAFGEH